MTVAYGHQRVLDGLSVAISRGGITALCGPNGCGKSTLLRSLAGLQPLAGGQVLLEGRPLQRLTRRERARTLAVLAQANETPPGLTVTELVTHGRHAHRHLLGGLSAEDRRAIADAIEAVGLTAEASRPVTALSGGERQRAWIAMALAQQCRVLLLDEPTTWLDIRHQVELVDALRVLNHTRGITIVCVLHDLNQAAAIADRIMLMKNGKILHDGTTGATLMPGPLRETFGVEMWRLDHPASDLPVCLPSFGPVVGQVSGTQA
ncbi:iron complex transport system ATP-binding protein [Arboricoccus pini]|uniref:Iron complex transport system ATP-binding protein n=1 Tax=Arboricoccus pini TaxID=1963835 RepID=A0A212RK36_9PROT|nr:iron complex transport system ATP-binding protein [Arboricoccus pini]